MSYDRQYFRSGSSFELFGCRRHKDTKGKQFIQKCVSSERLFIRKTVVKYYKNE